MSTIVYELEWNETDDDQYEARRGLRRYVIWKLSEGWRVLAYECPNPDADTEVILGDPVLRPTLEEAQQQAQWWESGQKLWPKQVAKPRD